MSRLAVVIVSVALLAAACSNVQSEIVDTRPTDPPTTATTAPPANSTATTLPVEVGGADGLGDSFYPYMGNGGYDVQHYEIDLDINPAANTIQAVTTITARADQKLAAFNLDLSGLAVESVAVDGSDAEFSRQATELVIVPADPPAEGAEFSTVVRYSGTPEPIDDPGVPFARLGWHHRDNVIYTVNEPSGAMSWFPSNNHPTDKATFEIHLTVPEPFTAAATGVLLEEAAVNGHTTTTWHMDDPMATYLAAIYVGEFERIETALADGLLIRDYLPAADAEGVADALSITPAVIRYFESLLGPYPYDVYGTIVMPFGLGFALENQTLSVHGRYAIDPLTVSHEIVHQWLGNSSTLDDWRDIWLHEGFATYLSFMYLNEHHGMDLDVQMAELHANMAETGSVPPLEIDHSELFGEDVYLRGALTLHALRNLVGDTVFAQILRTHYQQSAHSNTNTGNFLAIVTQLAGEEAAELVESWLHDDPIPEP